MKTYSYFVNHPGEIGAGILPYSENVVIEVIHDPGGDDSGEYSFQAYMLQSLKEWFDGASVELTHVKID